MANQGEPLKISIPQQLAMGVGEKREKEKSVSPDDLFVMIDTYHRLTFPIAFRNVQLCSRMISLRLQRWRLAIRLLVRLPNIGS